MAKSPVDILQMIENTNPGRNDNDMARRVVKLGEEAGELAQAFLDVTSSDNRKGKTWDDVREECVDTSIIALDLALTANPLDLTNDRGLEEIKQQIVEMMDKKLTRWKERIMTSQQAKNDLKQVPPTIILGKGKGPKTPPKEEPQFLYEILVPTVRNNGKPFHLRHHKVWDAKVRKITGGLTIVTPTKGQWVSPDGTEFHERMIPVRIFCRPSEIEKISDITAKHYEQLAVMFYKISEEVKIKHYATPSTS